MADINYRKCMRWRDAEAKQESAVSIWFFFTKPNLLKDNNY